MIKDPQAFLNHILESIEWIEKDIKDLTKREFLKDVPIQDAVIRRMEIIGEAVRNIPANLKIKYPETPWKKIAGMRDKLIHQYFGVELDLVWEVAKKDIPVLKKEIKRMLDNK